MDKIEKQLLTQITDRLVAEFNSEKIILFGSHAWGNPHPDSDLDLLVVISSSDLPSTQRAPQAYRCLQRINVPIELIVSTNQELERFRLVPAALAKRTHGRGIKIYE